MYKEYLKLDKIEGPLIVLSGVEGVSYGEIIEIKVDNKKTRSGKVIKISGDLVVAQVFEGTSGLSTSNTAPGVSVSKTNDSKNSLRGIYIGDASVNDLESDRSTNIREIVSTMKGSCKLTTAPTNLTNGNLLHVDANIFSIINEYKL